MRTAASLVKWLLAIAICAVVGASAQADEIPRYWYKTMRNSPDSNYALRKYGGPLNSELTTKGRNVVLAMMLSSKCQGASINKNVFREYILSSGLLNSSEGERKTMSGSIESVFIQFDYRDLAHLCSGVDYLFGPKGVLIKGVIAAGNGKPSQPFEGFGGYMRPPVLNDVLRGIRLPKTKHDAPIRA